MTIRRQILAAAAVSALCSMSAIAGETSRDSHGSQGAVVKVEALDPFTHVASIPEGSDPASIKFESVKMVKVATESKSTMDAHACEVAAAGDPGGSMYCPYTELQSPVAAYQVTYSYLGQPLPSDEYGNGHFTFSVNLRPDELSADVRTKLSEHNMAKADVAGFFELSTYRDTVQEEVIDEAASTFCSGNYVDGLWAHTDSSCEDTINAKTITVPSSYITVKVDAASPVLSASAAE